MVPSVNAYCNWYNETAGHYQNMSVGFRYCVGNTTWECYPDDTFHAVGNCCHWYNGFQYIYVPSPFEYCVGNTTWQCNLDGSFYAVGYCGVEISAYDIPINVLLDNTYNIKAWIKNTGGSLATFYVGLSIGNIYPFPSGKICNRDCYQDGLGDYAQITLSPGEGGLITRSFKFRSDYFTDGQNADVLLDVFNSPYQPPENAQARVNLTDYVSVSQPAPFAYAQSCVASRSVVSLKDILSITCYINNNGTLRWNYTLGMSIGLWTVQSGHIYSSIQPPALTPCNLECYRDGLGDWVFKEIPVNYTSYFIRKFYIPDYFLLNNSFDVVVDIWSIPPTDGLPLISAVYFKNISYVSDIPSEEAQVAEGLRSSVDAGVDVLAVGLGTSVVGAKLLIWVLFDTVITVVVMYVSGRGHSPTWQIGYAVFLALFIVGGLIGSPPFVPAWITIVFVLVAGFSFAYFMSKTFGG
jgi:hypothetical protein